MTDQTIVYISTWSDDQSEGIYTYRLDPTSGALEFIRKTAPVYNPFYIITDSAQRYLFAANADKEKVGAVSAFSIDSSTAELTYLNQQSSGGVLPCYLSIDNADGHLLVGNYMTGDLAVLPVADDGQLGPATDVVRHEGSSINSKRQEGPHVHSIVLDDAGRYAFAADLGIDRVMIYEFDATEGKLTPNDQPWAEVKPGAGPRHFAFHPGGRCAYILNELDATVTAFDYDAARGRLSEVQTISTLPGGFEGENLCADVKILSSGTYLYCTNRGHDSIAIFSVDESTGTLTPAGHEPTQGGYPWNIALDPTESFLLVANWSGNSVVVFRIDQQTGRLASTGHSVEVPNPICLKMLE